MADTDTLTLGARALQLTELRRLYEGPVRVSIDPQALQAVTGAHALIGRLAAAEALAQEGITAPALGPKEGLALLNGTQVSTALALAGLFELETVFAGAVVSGMLATDALRGSDAPFDPRIHRVRGHDGQARVA